MRRSVSLILFAICALAQICLADPAKFTVDFPDQGDRTVYLQKKDQLQQTPTDARKVGGKAVDMQTSLDPATDGKDVVLVIIDGKKNTAFTTPLADVIKNSGVKVADAMYNLVAETRISVQAKGGSLQSGIVHVETKEGKEDILLTSSDKGIATLRLRPPGDLKVSVDYKTGGQSKTLPAQTFETKLAAPKADLIVTVTDPVDVVSDTPPAAPASATSPGAAAASGPAVAGGPPRVGANGEDLSDDEKAVAKAHKDTGGFASVLGSLMSVLFGLIVVAGVVGFLWWYIKNNQKQVQTVLHQAGVPVVTDPADPTGIAPVTQAAPQPMQKIVLDPSSASIAPIPGVTGLSAAPAGSSLVKNPRLVADDGSIFMLADGENSVGREGAVAVLLAGESSVSRHHANVTVSGGSISVSDLGSTNGTFVNGSKISSPTPIHPGDSVQFGARRLRYED